jgi:hypothetical protein
MVVLGFSFEIILSLAWRFSPTLVGVIVDRIATMPAIIPSTKTPITVGIYPLTVDIVARISRRE